MKKMLKNLLSVFVIASILLGAFAGCKKEDSATDKTEAAEKSASQAADEKKEDKKTPSEEKTEKAEGTEEAEDVDFLTADKGDKKAFTSFMEYILGYGRYSVGQEPPHGDEGYSEKDYFEYNYADFDCTGSDAFEYAFACMLGIPYAGMEFCLREAYGIEYDSYFTECISSDEADPLNKFDGCDEYAKFDGKMFDSVLENVFNVKPDHNFISDSNDENVDAFAYYYNGEYYIYRSQGGDGAGPRVVINDMQVRSDGKYDADITYQWGNDPDGYSDIENLKVVAGLKDWEGSRIWSLYSVSKA